MRGLFFMLLAVALAILAGCEDNTIYNNYVSPTGEIIGSLVPRDSGTVIAISDSTYEVPISSRGYFRLAALEPGIYEVVILPVHHSKRALHEIIVKPDEGVVLREVIVSSYPYPIYKVAPSDNAQYTSRYSYIELFSDEPLDTQSLRVGTHIEPPFEGTWTTRQIALKDGSNTLRSTYAPLFPLASSTTYHVTIDSSVATESGMALGSDLTFSFTTEQPYFDVTFPEAGTMGGIPLRSFRVEVFCWSDCLITDSVAKAIYFEPAIDGVWFPNRRYWEQCDSLHDAHLFIFIAHEPLFPKTSYTLFISEEVNLGYGIRLAWPYTVAFTSEPYGVTSVEPTNGSFDVPPGAPVEVSFNTPMDTASVREAFGLLMIGGISAEGSLVWNQDMSHLTFVHSETPFESQRLYKITILKSARAASGTELERDFESYFVVR